MVGERCDALNHLFPKRDESNKQPEDPRHFFCLAFFSGTENKEEEKEKGKPME